MLQTKNPPRFVHQSCPLDMQSLWDKNPRKECIYEMDSKGVPRPRIVIGSSDSFFIPSETEREFSDISLINQFDAIDYANELENRIFNDTDNIPA